MFSGFLVGRSLCLICLRLFLSRGRRNKSSVKGLGWKIWLIYLDFSYKLLDTGCIGCEFIVCIRRLF